MLQEIPMLPQEITIRSSAVKIKPMDRSTTSMDATIWQSVTTTPFRVARTLPSVM